MKRCLGRSVARWFICVFWMKWWLIWNKRLYLECVGSPYHSSSLFLGIYMIALWDGSNCPVPNWSCPSPFFSHFPNALAVARPISEFTSFLKATHPEPFGDSEIPYEINDCTMREWWDAPTRQEDHCAVGGKHPESWNESHFSGDGNGELLFLGRKVISSHPRLVLGQEKSGMKQNIDLVVDLDRYYKKYLWRILFGVRGSGIWFGDDFLEPGTLMIEVITPTGWAKNPFFLMGWNGAPTN